jgi:hypothetical protein
LVPKELFPKRIQNWSQNNCSQKSSPRTEPFPNIPKIYSFCAFVTYSKIIQYGIVYSAIDTEIASTKYDSSYVKLCCGKFARLVRILKAEKNEDSEIYILVRLLFTQFLPKLKLTHQIVSTSDQLELKKFKDVCGIACYVNIASTEYLTEVPKKHFFAGQ